MSYYSETAAEDSCFNTTAVREYTCSDPFSLGSALYACPYGCRSGACISYAANQLPSVSGVTLLSSSGSGLPGDNITVNYTLSDSDNNSVRGIVDWRLSGSSIAVLNMPFDTNSSVSARDYSTYSHDGNLGGGNESRAPKWQRGKVGGAYAFDGIDDFINTTVSNISSQLTVEAWVKLARQMVTFEKQFVVNGYRFSLSLVDGVPQAELSYNPDYVDLYADDALTTGAWYHLALVVDSTNATLYIDGQPVDSSNASAGRYINNSNSGLYIGAANSIGAYYYFNGSIDELRIYNQSLSRQQILADYTAGLANHTSLILVSPQAEVQWTAAVTPNDGLADGTAASSSLTLTTPSPTTQNPGGGSNSPGGSTSSVAPRLAPPSEEAEFNFGLIVPGLEFSSTLGNSFALRRIRIDAIQPLPNTQLIIAKVESLSEPPTGVYQFLNITSNVNFSRVKSLRLEFAVNKSWIRKMGRNLSDIRMARLHSDWEYLNTSLVTQDSIRAYYSAQLTGMSIFAITYQKKEAIVNVTAPAVNQTASEPDQKQPGKPVELYWMSFIAALIVFSLISFSYVTKSILKAKDPFEKLHFAREMLNSGQHQKASEIYASIVYSIDKHNLSPAKRDLLARELNGLYNLLMNKGS